MRSKETDQLFNRGLKFLKNKKFDEAKICFEKVIKIFPNNPDANHALGIISGINGKHQEAKRFFEKTLQVAPNFKESLLNLAISLTELDDFFKSQEIFNKLISVYQNDPNIYLQFGNCLAKQKKFDDAKNCLEKSIILNASNPEAYKKLGLINKEKEDFDEAISNFSKALNLDKDHIQTLFQLGETYYFCKKYSEAIKYLKKIISLTKDKYYLLLAKELLAKTYDANREYDKSIEIFKDILNSYDENKVKEKALANLSCVYISSKEKDVDADYTLGQHYAYEVLKLNKNNIVALSNMGITHNYMRNYRESLDYFLKANELEPLDASTLKNLSTAYDSNGFYDKSLEAIKKYKEIRPDNKSLDANLAFTNLHLGNFKEGWHFYESRWNEKNADGTIKKFPDFSKPLWKPELGYNSILIWGEQGIGDQILHGTMLEDFCRKFKKIYLSVDPKLVKIFSESFPNFIVYSLFEETSKDFFDYHLPLCSLGKYCRGSFKDFYPPRTYYNIKKNNHFHTPNKKFKCAISWKSVNGQKSDIKSTTLESLLPVLRLKNIDFYNIQYSNTEDELNYLEDKYNIKLNTIKDLDIFNDIYGTMQFIQSCDFTITTSSSNAHLSGALNIPTYLLLPKSLGKFWYWDNIYERKNVWYPSVKRFIQKDFDKWDQPIQDLAEFIIDKYNLVL